MKEKSRLFKNKFIIFAIWHRVLSLLDIEEIHNGKSRILLSR